MANTILTHATQQRGNKRSTTLCGKVVPTSRIREDKMFIVCSDCYRIQKQLDELHDESVDDDGDYRYRHFEGK